jgi:hypothetical protein
MKVSHFFMLKIPTIKDNQRWSTAPELGDGLTIEGKSNVW